MGDACERRFAGPAGRAFSAVETRTAMLTDPRNPLSHTALGETLTVNGRAWSSSYAASTRQVTSTTPAGRTVLTTLDAKGKPTRVAPPGVPAIDLAYDASGRVKWVTQAARTLHVEYDAVGLPWRLTDPLSRQVTFEYDQAGRVWRRMLPGGRQVSFGRDPNGNLTSLAPPGRQAHGFGYWPGDAVRSYDPPAASAGGPLWPTGYGYDLDGALTSVAHGPQTTDPRTPDRQFTDPRPVRGPQTDSSAIRPGVRGAAARPRPSPRNLDDRQAHSAYP